jgi:hypothetical protein
VQNAGPFASTFTQVGWQVPANVDVLNLATSRGTCAVSASHRLSCDIGVLAENQPTTVTMTLRGNSGGTLGINLSAGAAEIDRNPTNNTYTNSAVRFVESVDLAATLTINPLLVNSGSALEYILVVSNNGPNAASGGSFETTFDARDQYVLAQGSATGCTGNVAGLQVCPLPTIASGASVTYRWTVTPQWGGARTPGVIVRPDTRTASIPTRSTTPRRRQPTWCRSPICHQPHERGAGRAAGCAAGAHRDRHEQQPDRRRGCHRHAHTQRSHDIPSATGAVCTSTGNVVGCAIGMLSAGASRAITINVNAISPGAATSTFSAASVGPDRVAEQLIERDGHHHPTTSIGDAHKQQRRVYWQSSGPDAHRQQFDANGRLAFAPSHAERWSVSKCHRSDLRRLPQWSVAISVPSPATRRRWCRSRRTRYPREPLPTTQRSRARLRIEHRQQCISAQIGISVSPPPRSVAEAATAEEGGGGGGGGFDLLSLFALVVVLASYSRGAVALHPRLVRRRYDTPNPGPRFSTGICPAVSTAFGFRLTSRMTFAIT